MNNRFTRQIVAKRGSKPYIRWWWFADPIEKADITRQIQWISGQGFGGIEIAWVYPSKQNGAPAPFLSPQWSELVLHAWQECEKYGLICDLTFGSLWPFGGSFVPEKHASKTWQGLSKQQLTRSWESAYSDAPRRVIDHLDRKALDYYAGKMVEGFAPVLEHRNKQEPDERSPAAFFCDSLEVDPEGLWTDAFDERFFQRYGYRLLPHMEEINQHPHRRFEYRQMVSELFIEEFFKPYVAICEKEGMLSRIQAHGALTDILYAFSLCDIPESEALLFDPEFSYIPASASVLAGRPVTSCETFTCIYGWKPYPQRGEYMREEKVGDLRLLSDALFASGVNHIIWHGMPFSSTGDDGEFYATVYVGPKGSLTPHLRKFNAYMEFLSSHLQQGEPFTEMAVYLPVEDLQLLHRLPEEKIKPSNFFWWEMQELRWPEAAEGYHPTWVSTPFLKDARFETESRLISIGEAHFSCLFVDAEWISLEALSYLTALAAAGAPVVCPELPKEPGTVTHPREYQERLKLLDARRINLEEMGRLPIKPFIEALDEAPLPLYRCRKENGNITCFIAPPGAKGLRFPMEYGLSETLSPCSRRFRFTIPLPGGGSHSIEKELHFGPAEPLLLQFNIEALATGDGKGIREVELPEWK